MRLNALPLLFVAVAMGSTPIGAQTASSKKLPTEEPPREGKARPRKAKPAASEARPTRRKIESEKPEPSLIDAAHCAAWERTVPINSDGGLHIGLKTYAQTLQLKDYEVVLTFDDGPWPETTPAVLDALKGACAHATFFLIGHRTVDAPHLAKREKDEGHTVGHHSFTHPPFTLRGYDEASAKQDIDTGVSADERAIYGDPQAAHPHVPFFRFPGFADTPELLDYLDKKGYVVFGTDLWAADWMRMSADYERQRVLRILEDAPHHNGIILFHDNIRSTARMLPGLLRELRRRHYTIAHLVYDPKAPAPDLTPPVKGWTHETSETEQIIQHLRIPIVPGGHRAGAQTDDVGPSGDVESGPR